MFWCLRQPKVFIHRFGRIVGRREALRAAIWRHAAAGFGTYEHQSDVVLADIGIMLTPRFIVGADLRACGPAQGPAHQISGARVVHDAVYPERRHLTPKLRPFIELVVERLAREL